MSYSLAPTASIGGTFRVGTLIAAPSDLRAVFGEPMESDGHKVSGEYVFASPDGSAVFTVYDYKATSLYDNDLPEPVDFWSSRTPFDFSIGGRERGPQLAAFEAWLASALRELAEDPT